MTTTDWTVTIAAAHQADDQAPYTYVVRADSMDDAIDKIRAWLADKNEESSGSLTVVHDKTFAGAPPANCGYYWNDLRNLNVDAANRHARAAAVLADYRAFSADAETELEAFANHGSGGEFEYYRRYQARRAELQLQGNRYAERLALALAALLDEQF